MDRCPERDGKSDRLNGLLVCGITGWGESASRYATSHVFCHHGLAKGIKEEIVKLNPRGCVVGILWDSFSERAARGFILNTLGGIDERFKGYPRRLLESHSGDAPF
jgi:hypothetical protein